MFKLPIRYRVVALLYALSACWCAGWIAHAPGRQKVFLLPATMWALFAIAVAVGLLAANRIAYVSLWIHVGAWAIIAPITTIFVTDNTSYLYFAVAHVVLASLPFLLPSARAPFFGGQRTPRSATRHEVSLQSFIEVDGKRRYGQTSDLSERGAFVAVPTNGLALRQRVVVQMHLRANKFLRLPAHVVTLNGQASEANPEGVGVQWTNPTANDKESIAHFIQEGLRQNKMRTPLKLSATFVWKKVEHTCDLYNLTVEGCYLDDKARVLQPGNQVALNIHLAEGDTIEVLAEVMWLPGDATIVAVTKIVGSVLEFRGLSKKDAQRIAETQDTLASQPEG